MYSKFYKIFKQFFKNWTDLIWVFSSFFSQIFNIPSSFCFFCFKKKKISKTFNRFYFFSRWKLKIKFCQTESIILWDSLDLHEVNPKKNLSNSTTVNYISTAYSHRSGKLQKKKKSEKIHVVLSSTFIVPFEYSSSLIPIFAHLIALFKHLQFLPINFSTYLLLFSIAAIFTSTFSSRNFFPSFFRKKVFSSFFWWKEFFIKNCE